jgi:hypothetical protein
MHDPGLRRRRHRSAPCWPRHARPHYRTYHPIRERRGTRSYGRTQVSLPKDLIPTHGYIRYQSPEHVPVVDTNGQHLGISTHVQQTCQRCHRLSTGIRRLLSGAQPTDEQLCGSSPNHRRHRRRPIQRWQWNMHLYRTSQPQPFQGQHLPPATYAPGSHLAPHPHSRSR